MNGMAFFPKLAWRSIAKNKRIYLPYMLTASGIIMMFYIVFHLNQDPEIAGFTSGATLQLILGLGAVVIGIFAVIFLFYTNSFLMKRRKTELGLYNVLGLGKIHIARVLFWESLYMIIFSLILGMGLGALLSKIGQLGLFRLLNIEPSYTFSINFHVMGFTAVFFSIVFALIYVSSLRQISRSSARELLASGQMGEKEPRANILLALAGVILLGAGYVISQIIDNPMAAIGMFFIAVILVILGTYCCFIAGSVALLKLLRKNKNYYYKTRHFVSVSSMIYRMKRNGAGLASICILSTMVLVMISSTACMYLGGAAAVKAHYPRDMQVGIGMTGGEKAGYETAVEAVTDWAEKTCSSQGVRIENQTRYRFGRYYMKQTGNEMELVTNTNAQEMNLNLRVLPLEDYNISDGRAVSLNHDQVMVYDERGEFSGNTLKLFGKEYQVAEVLDSISAGKSANIGYNSIYVVVPDMAEFYRIYDAAEQLHMKENSTSGQAEDPDWYAYALEYDFAFDGSQMSEEQMNSIETALYQLNDTGYEEAIAPVFTARHQEPVFATMAVVGTSSREARQSFYSLYGGMLFLGILLSITFLLGTVLIMYYKQITEGYDDQGRFEILRKVGMSDLEIRRTINSQVLTVFFAPLIIAGCHILFAFHMIALMLSVFGIMDAGLLAMITLGVFLVFGLFYAAVYLFTSKAYYRIVA